MTKTGKPYANRHKVADRPLMDAYATPASLISCAELVFRRFLYPRIPVLDPCCGESHVFRKELGSMGYEVVENDIIMPGGHDFLHPTSESLDAWKSCHQIAMNPPFSKWDEFVFMAKSYAMTVIAIGRLNYLSTQSRLESDIWDGLCHIAVFSRYVDYQTPIRTDGQFHVGAMATGWFVWQRGYRGEPTVSFVDVDRYATLGQFSKKPENRRKRFEDNNRQMEMFQGCSSC